MKQGAAGQLLTLKHYFVIVPFFQIDCIVTTAGGVEEDFIKCLASTYLGEFRLSGRELRSKGINRIGNLLVPNDNYCKFEDWINPILDKMLEEQNTQVSLKPPEFLPFLELNFCYFGRAGSIAILPWNCGPLSLGSTPSPGAVCLFCFPM